MKKRWVYFGLRFSNPLYSLFLKLPEKSARPKWTMTEIRIVCLSVILEFYLLLSVCNASIVYTSLCRGLKYLLKVQYIILVYPNLANYLITNTVLCCRMETLPYVWKKYHKNERHLCIASPNIHKMYV